MARQQTQIIRLNSVSKRFVVHHDKSLKDRIVGFRQSRRHRQDFWALNDVSLDIEAGTTVGLIGHNGSGKSTLLKTIGGIIRPTSGDVWRRGRLAALLELGAGFHADLSGRDNVYLNASILGLSRKETSARFDEMVEFSGIEEFIDTPVKFYSSGMYVRLAFAVAVHVDPDILLVDEVLAVGDEPFQKKCLDRIEHFQHEGRTIVLVSHSADQVGRMCERVVVLNNGELSFDGAPAEGLGVLRRQYEEGRVRAGVEGERGVPSGPMAIRQVRSHVKESRGVVSVTVEVDVRMRETRPGWGVTLSLDTTLGMRLFEMDTLGLGVSLPLAKGDHTIEITFPEASLGPGVYLVNAALEARDGRTFDRLLGAATVEIPHRGVGRGVLHLEPRVSFDGKGLR